MADPVRLVPAGKRAPDDLGAQLRELADQADRGEIEALVLAATISGVYEMRHACSIADGLVLANLLHDSALRKFRP